MRQKVIFVGRISARCVTTRLIVAEQDGASLEHYRFIDNVMQLILNLASIDCESEFVCFLPFYDLAIKHCKEKAINTFETRHINI